MSVKNDQDNKKITGGAIATIIIMLLSMMGAAAIPLLIIGGIGYAAYIYTKKQSEQQSVSMAEALKNKSTEMMNKLDEIEESGRIPTVSDLFSDARRKEFRKNNSIGDDSARKHMESKFDLARKRQKASDGETLYSMLSRSEQKHYDSFSTDTHDEYTHRAEELKDLLNAGIIDSAEYKDRMAMLKTEFKR